MKLFLDTANLNEIEDAMNKGVIQGVTTNPSLLAKEPKTDFYKHIQKIVNLCKEYKDGVPLSVEVFAMEPEAMITQAGEIIQELNYDNLNIKVPVGYNELEVISNLSQKGIKVNCTCCFTATQMQLAALSGAKYVSLFYNRLFDVSGDPLKTLRRVRDFIDSNDLDCEIIAGSIRNSYDLEDAWAAGAHIVTAGYNVVKKSTKHPKTDESVDGFLKDFNEWIK
tara:strand:- start:262 stop:930 length:669 start_codon:yes stop_codon:yes gene_type:complete